MLYICGTPIGNLDDITFRILDTLKMCDYIACEDTRHTLKLTNFYEIETKGKLISYHEHNKHEKGMELIRLMQDGKNIALVSDAGMPGISDPGEDLVKLCYENSVPFTTVPSATALVSALVLSGMSTRNYIFDGFLPTNKKERRELLESYKNESRTVIIYEAPHHIKKTLKEIAPYVEGRTIAIARELTKKFEEILKGTTDELLNHFEETAPRGEMVVIIEGVSKEVLANEKIEQWDNISIDEHMDIYLNQGLSEKDAMKAVAKDKGVGKRDIYNLYKK